MIENREKRLELEWFLKLVSDNREAMETKQRSRIIDLGDNKTDLDEKYEKGYTDAMDELVLSIERFIKPLRENYLTSEKLTKTLLFNWAK
jgi:hypothetical protein